tara:strand:+ start:33 stop:338 length:306 start_codon:yes stop_codon:yes gene_type:complete
MSDVIGLSDVSSKDTGRGSKLKTGGRRKYNMKNKVKSVLEKKMEKDLRSNRKSKSKDKCAKWKELGYSSLAGCRHDNPRKRISSKDIMGQKPNPGPRGKRK